MRRQSSAEWQVGRPLACYDSKHSQPSRTERHSGGSSDSLPTSGQVARDGMEMAGSAESAVSNLPRREGIHHTLRPHILGEKLRGTLSYQDSGKRRERR